MEPSHLIHSMNMQMDFTGCENATIENLELDSWIRNEVLVNLDGLLNELFPNSVHVFIDQLNLDLGDWKEEEYKNQIPRYFERKLRSELSTYVKTSSAEHPHIKICCEVLEQICLPLLPKAEEEKVRKRIQQVARIYSEGNRSIDIFDLSEKIIFELSNAFPVIQPRQFATIAYPRLKRATSPIKSAHHTTATAAPETLIDNAGLVIVAPYLGHLFRMLNLMEERRFKSDASVKHALRILHYVVNGNLEYDASPKMLDMILCGLSANDRLGSETLDKDEFVSTEEMELVDQMLKSIIQHWSAIGSTSVQGLRDTFLRHAGWIRKEEDSWSLKVHNGPFDVLLDRLPWGISMVKFDWMPTMLKVKWR